MKKNTHPEYHDVLFVDSSTGNKFICGSTLKTDETEMFQGKKYPVCRVSVSSSSHPFFTGSNKFVDAEGRVDKFRKRYTSGKQKNEGKEQTS
jgi:large subunit ribosomal protein L31